MPFKGGQRVFTIQNQCEKWAGQILGFLSTRSFSLVLIHVCQFVVVVVLVVVVVVLILRVSLN